MARRPIFRGQADRYVATQRIQIVEGTYIEPGEAIPATIRRATLRRWFLTRQIGPVGDPWTAHLLGRRQRRLEEDKAAKRMHPGGEADLARIAKALAGKPPKAEFQPPPMGAAAKPGKHGGAQGVSPTKAADKATAKGAAGAPPPAPPAPPAPGATFGGPLPPPPPPPPPAPAIEPVPAPELAPELEPAAPEGVSDAEPERQPEG